MADPADVTGLHRRWRADTIAQANATAVSSWAALVGGAALTQATAANQPTYHTGAINGQPVVRFDGVNDMLSATVTAQAQPITATVVVDLAATTDGMPFNAEGVEVYVEAGKWNGWGGAALAAPGNATTNPVVVTWVANGASSQLYIDGTLVASGNGGTTGINTTTATVGNYSAGGYPMNGDLAEVIVYTKALTAGERATVHSYVQDRYAITVADYAASSTAKTGTAAGSWSFTGTAAGTVTQAGPAPGTVDPRLYEVLRGPHFAYGYVEAWRGGSAVEVEIDGRLTTRLPMVDGSVEVDGSTPGARRVLSASFAPLPGLFDALAPTGTELKAFLVVRGPDGVEQTTPQGVFGIDAQRMGYAANGGIRITAPDRWKRVMDSRFLVPRASLAGATVRQQIVALLLEAMPAGVAVADLGTSAATVPAQVWDRDRDKAIEELAKAASLDVFMDRNGVPTIRDAPTIDPENVAWTVDAGALGVMVSAERERNRQRTYNIVVVNGTPNEGVAPFPTVFLWDGDPNSQTFAGPGGSGTTPPDPSLAGPFGQRPTFYASPLLRDIDQALAAGYTILERVSGLASQLTLSTVPKPDLDDGATILVKLPPEFPRGPIPLELHIVDRMTVPLRPSKGDAMGISTRSTLVGYEGAE